MLIREVTYGDLKDDIAELEADNKHLRKTLEIVSKNLSHRNTPALIKEALLPLLNVQNSKVKK